MFLVDTDVLSALAKRRRDANVEAWMARQRIVDLFVSVVSIGEIERGSVDTSVSRIGVKGSGKIKAGWEAGYRIELQAAGDVLSGTSENDGDDGSGGRPRQPDHPTLQESWVVSLGGLTIGLTHWAPVPERPNLTNLAGACDRFFGGVKPDIVVHGDTHVEDIRRIGDILCVNPGSPTFPHNLAYQFGTIGFIDIDDAGTPSASIWQVCDDGVEPFDWTRWNRPW